MRAYGGVVLLLLQIGCERRASTVQVNDAEGQRLADTLVKLPENHLVYLHEIGWFQMEAYHPNRHEPDPRPHDPPPVEGEILPWWTSTPQLAAALARNPPPRPAAYRDEIGRYMAAIHDGDQNPRGEDAPLDVTRLVWADEIADRIQRDLLDHAEANIPHVGDLYSSHDDIEVYVRFRVSPELEERLKARR